jgi:hypothetical protein
VRERLIPFSPDGNRTLLNERDVWGYGRLIGVFFLPSVLFTTWRTSARHQRPLGFFSAQRHPPDFFSTVILSMIKERPFLAASSSISSAVYPKQ